MGCGWGVRVAFAFALSLGATVLARAAPAAVQPNTTSCCPLLRTRAFADVVASCLGWPEDICGFMHHDRFYRLGGEAVLRCIEIATMLTPPP